MMNLDNYIIDYYNRVDVLKPDVIAFIYPKELKNEDILKDNITQIISNNYIYDIVKLQHLLICDKKTMNSKFFDVEKTIYYEMIKKHENKIFDLKQKLNRNLSPYYWELQENKNNEIEADYILLLQKENRDIDY